MSDYLFHFTKGSNAFETLSNIVECQKIIDVNDRGYICFSEAPITLLSDMFEIFDNYKEPMYAPYGIGIKKDWLFSQGARPVIYGSPNERNDFPPSVQWRFVEYDPNTYDFSWLREWRIQDKQVELSYENCFIVTPTSNECEELIYDGEVDITMDGDVEDGEFHSYANGSFHRSYKGVSLEDIAKLKKLSKNELASLLNKQGLDDKRDRYLGSL